MGIGLGAALGAASLVTGVVGQVKAAEARSQAAEEREKARKAKQRIQEQKQQRAKEAQIAEARQKRARVANVAAQTGTQETSSFKQARGSIGSQLADNLSFLETQERAGDFITERQNAAAEFQEEASVFQGLGNVTSGTLSAASQNTDLFTDSEGSGGSGGNLPVVDIGNQSGASGFGSQF